MGSWKVDLENCCISDEAVNELRKMLNLHELRLGVANPKQSNGNCFSGEGFKNMMIALPSMQLLKVLEMRLPQLK